jgi:hypothetical protein
MAASSETWTTQFLKAIGNVAGIQSPLPTASTAHKKKAPGSAINWIRKNDPRPADIDDATLSKLANLAIVSPPSIIIDLSGEKRSLIEAWQWLRRNDDVKPGDLNDAMLSALANLACVPVPRTSANPEQKTRMKALEESVSWLRKQNPNASDLDDPTALAISNQAKPFPRCDHSRRPKENCRRSTGLAPKYRRKDHHGIRSSGNRSTCESRWSYIATRKTR